MDSIPHISSLDNPRIRDALRLREQRHRRATGLFLAEGVREVSRAAGAGLVIREVFGCEAMLPRARELVPAGARYVSVADRVLAKLAYRENPEGVVAVAERPQRRLGEVAVGEDSLVLVAVGVAKPGNLGAMARTADAAGCVALLLVDSVVDAFNPNAIRASTCAVFSLAVIGVSTEEALKWLGEKGFRTIAADPGRGAAHTGLNLRGRVAVVIGAEDRGLDAEWLNCAQGVARIEMRGRTVDSLNASVSAAVLLFEAVRQRGEPRA